MSRSGYTDDCEDQWALIRWRGAVKASITGQRGQNFLRELAAAMDAMPEKRLIANDLQAEGAFCTLGVIGAARGLDMSHVDPEDRERVAKLFDVAEALAAEIQNNRCSRVFKQPDRFGGQAYDLDGRVFREPNCVCFTSRDSMVPVTFPYTPTTEYVDVPASQEVR